MSKRRRYLLQRMVLGSIALGTWVLFFGSGMLCETVTERKMLSPNLYAAQAAIDGKATDSKASEATRLVTLQHPWGSLEFSRVTIEAAPTSWDKFEAFLWAMACFTPTNLVFLTLSAGLLGGCASNLAVGGATTRRRIDVDPNRLRYLSETPWAGMMRSFIVYLCVIGGLYFIMDDPFKNPSPSQYMRLAGMLSVLAFVVGYDPSRIEQWIGLIPNPQPRTERATVLAVSQGQTSASAAIVEHQGSSETALFKQSEPEVDGRAKLKSTRVGKLK